GRVCPITDHPAVARPCTQHQIREFRLTVLKNAVAAIERSYRIDVTLRDEGASVGWHPVLMKIEIIEQKAGAIFCDFKRDDFWFVPCLCIDQCCARDDDQSDETKS